MNRFNKKCFLVLFQIKLSRDARNTAWVSFDGRKRQEICQGDRLVHMPSCGVHTHTHTQHNEVKLSGSVTYKSIRTFDRLDAIMAPESDPILHVFRYNHFLLLRTSKHSISSLVFFTSELSLFCLHSSITITTSCFPVPSICFRDPVNDWFESLAQCLHWNVRKKQNYLNSEDEEF